MNKLMVIDGNSIVNRAFYGVSQNLTTRSGQPTNAILGFLNILNKLVDEEEPDVYEALARRYLNIGCSVMTPNPNRLELLGRLIDEYKVDGVVEMTLQACHTYNVESFDIRRFVNEEKGIPYINVETDYSQADIGQLNTRIAAFIEML